MLKTYRIIPLVFILFLFEILVLCSVPGNDVEAQTADSVAGLRQELKELSAQIQLLLQKQDSLKTRLDSLENQPIANPPITPKSADTAPSIPPTPVTGDSANYLDNLLNLISNEWVDPVIGEGVRVTADRCGNWHHTMNTFQWLGTTDKHDFAMCFCEKMSGKSSVDAMAKHNPLAHEYLTPIYGWCQTNCRQWSPGKWPGLSGGAAEARCCRERDKGHRRECG